MAALVSVGLLGSQPCFSEERIRTPTDKTLLTTNVLWRGLTNVQRFEPRFNGRFLIFTNKPPFQTGNWLRLYPFSLPTTNSNKELRERLLNLKLKFNIQDQAPAPRLGDYWLPGEFQSIIDRPVATPPLKPSQP